MQITHRAISSTLVPSFRFSPEWSLFLTRFGPPSPSPRVREFSWLAELTAFGKIASYPHRVAATSPDRSLCRRPVLHHPARSFYNEETRAQSIVPSVFRAVHAATATSSSSSLTAPSWITKSLPLLESVHVWYTRDPLTYVAPLVTCLSHVNLRRGPRKEETRDRNKRGEELTSGAYVWTWRIGRDVVDWSVRFLAVPRPCVSSGFLLLHQPRYTSFFFPSLRLSLPSSVPSMRLSIFVIGAFQSFCSVFFPLGRSPRYMDRRKSPSSLSYQQAAHSLGHSLHPVP